MGSSDSCLMSLCILAVDGDQYVVELLSWRVVHLCLDCKDGQSSFVVVHIDPNNCHSQNLFSVFSIKFMGHFWTKSLIIRIFCLFVYFFAFGFYTLGQEKTCFCES